MVAGPRARLPAPARSFAAQTGLTAYALMAAAEGAVHAYAEIAREDWKPYIASPRASGRLGWHDVARAMPSAETARRGREPLPSHLRLGRRCA